MDASSRAARIDLICSADARHLVRSLQQALTLRGLQVTLRDFKQPARGAIGVAVLTEEGPTHQQWQDRLATYASQSMVAFEQPLVPAGTEVFVLSGWPSRRADQVLAELADYLVREIDNDDSGPTRHARELRESGPLMVFGVVVALVAAMIYLLDSSATNDPPRADPAELLIDNEVIVLRPEALAPGAAAAEPAPIPMDDDALAPRGESSRGSGAAMPGRVHSERPGTHPQAHRQASTCPPAGIGTVPPVHLFTWRPVLQAPEVPRILAMVQPQYYLPEDGDCV